MKYELDLYRRTRAEPAPDMPAAIPGTPQLRREMREASDALIFFALHRQSIAAVATHSVNLLMQSARTLDARGEEPDVADLINAASTLIQDVRDKIDRALVLEDAEQLRWSTAMMELIVRGIMGVLLGVVPYATLMETVAARGDLKQLLIDKGAIRRPDTGGTDETH